MADWAELPPELLGLIAECLPLLADYVRFGAVCKAWEAAQCDARQPIEQPWLVLHETELDLGGGRRLPRGFFSLAERRSRYPDLPELVDKWCCGSSLGWLITTDPELSMHLFHPLSRIQIPLPTPPSTGFGHLYHRRKLRSLVMCKAIMSADPVANPNECVVMAIHGMHGKLTFCRPGDDNWTIVHDKHGLYFDVVYHHGRFYAAATEADAVVVELSPEPKTVVLAHHIGSKGFPNYLVELDGELLYIARLRHISWREDGDEICKTIKLEVFRLDEGTGKWAAVTDLVDRALFLTHSHAAPISPLDYPSCRKNHVYFADYHYNLNGMFAYDELGMCDLRNGKIEPVDVDHKDPFLPLLMPSVWMNPSLHPRRT